MECLTDQLASSGRTLLVEGGAAEGMHLDPISPLLYYNGLTSLLRPSKYKKAKQKKSFLMASLCPVSHCIYALIDGMDSG